VIDFHSVRKFDHVTAGFTAIDDLVAILYAARMIGVHHSDFDIAHSLRATLVHHGSLLDSLLFQPAADLRDADHHGIVLLRDLDRVADMIEMPVGAEQHVDFLDIFFFLGTHGIAHDPRIDEDGSARRSLNPESRMT